jgi:putative membrane protein
MLALASLALAVIAQTAPAHAPRDAGQSTAVDRRFMQEAAAGGRAEVDLGELAAKKARDPAVQEFARRMVTDHQTTNKELMQLAKRLGVSLSTALEPKQKALHDRLSKAQGDDFDRQYMAAMVEDHRADVAAFEREARDGRDPDVKAFAERGLPTLRRHLELAETTAESTSATAGRK